MAMPFVVTQEEDHKMNEEREAPSLCRWVRREREKAGLTQEEVARRMNMSLTGYRKYERGPREPKPERLREIAVALELPENYFFGGGVDTVLLQEQVQDLQEQLHELARRMNDQER